MIKYIEGNLFDFVDQHKPVIIPHVVNNVGVMRAGFVIPLCRQYENVKKSYVSWHKYNTEEENVLYQEPSDLGSIQILEVENGVMVANMMAQVLGGERPLFYNHLCTCMDSVANWLLNQSMCYNILAPQFGSGLAGGNWNIIKHLIEDCWCRRDINVRVVVYK